jgi:hypothetical protein
LSESVEGFSDDLASESCSGTRSARAAFSPVAGAESIKAYSAKAGISQADPMARAQIKGFLMIGRNANRKVLDQQVFPRGIHVRI